MDESTIDWSQQVTGAMIKEAREALGITHAELSRLSGVSYPGLRSMEAQSEKVPRVVASHKLRIFFASAGIIFNDGKVIEGHEWDRAASRSSEPTRYARPKVETRGRIPFTQEQKIAAHKAFLQKYENAIERFKAGEVLASIADDLGLTKERIRQIAKKAGLPPRRMEISASARALRAAKKEKTRLARQNREERNKKILNLHGGGANFSAIAMIFSLSPEQVRQIVRKALRRKR